MHMYCTYIHILTAHTQATLRTLEGNCVTYKILRKLIAHSYLISSCLINAIKTIHYSNLTKPLRQ